MTGPHDVGGDRWRHVGQWVLLDARLHLLSIGQALYQGISPRLDVTARRILLPRMRTASADHRPRTQVTEDFGRRWSVRVQPILGPASGEVLAVLGCYVPEHAELPEPPLVGGWEWHATPPGPDQQMRIFWSPDTFAVYGHPVPPGPGPHWWEAAQWLDEVVAGAHRADLQRVLETFLTATSDGLLIHSFAARTADGTRVHLRLAGRRDIGGTSADTWFRGVSTRVDNQGGAPPPPSTAAVLDAAFAVSADPLCAIDTDYEHIYMTSANFSDLGIELPPDRHLPKMVHPDDLPALRAFLEETARRPAETIGPVIARLATAGDGWMRLAFTGTGMRLSMSGPQHHVLCRITPAVG